MDKSTSGTGDELENSDKSIDSDKSDSEGETNLNTTDDLIAASMGLIKLGDHSHAEGNRSVVSDQLDVSGTVSDNGSSVGNNSSSSVLRDASRLYESHNEVYRSNSEVENGNISDLDHQLPKVIMVDKENAGTGSKTELTTESFHKHKTVDVNSGNNDLHHSDMSSEFENDIREEEVSHVLKTSLNQFLSSRLSRSRNLEDTVNSSGIRNNSDLKMNGRDVETYYPKGVFTPDTNDYSLNGLENCNNYSSPSLKSFEHHEKGMRYIIKSGNGSRSSDYNSQESMMFPEGSFTGQSKHRDSSRLGEWDIGKYLCKVN